MTGLPQNNISEMQSCKKWVPKKNLLCCAYDNYHPSRFLMLSRVLLSKIVYLTLSVVLPGKKICRLLPVDRFTSVQSDFRVFKLKLLFLALTAPATRTAFRQFLAPSLSVCTLLDQAVQGQTSKGADGELAPASFPPGLAPLMKKAEE